ncbi:FAD binding domain protein [Dendrothele bispora CBS 962.96]|uniref:FAD binding domain protein n=1 Tax=Dendrothele bispora (strain CBS 962.96) TaxID=1314807 RepID=A0A4S8M7F6_DENBC|nr:FAD binding domain protein [Dendrothele bispora CBS 962.96]
MQTQQLNRTYLPKTKRKDQSGTYKEVQPCTDVLTAPSLLQALMLLKVVFVAALASFTVGKNCRILPTDPSWPTQDVWDAFNNSVDGRLVKTIPLGSPCHDPTFDQEQCDIIQSNWNIPEFHEPSSSSMMDPIFLNKSCDPFDPRDTPCRIGAYVQYAVNISTSDQVIKTIEFVKQHDIRFVVRNTGHDYMGRSTGTGALAVWMHYLQDIDWIPNFKSANYTGSALKVQPGVLGFDLITEAHNRGVVTVSGECPSVGYAGGFIQGGGYGALSSSYGMAADQTLEFEVITTQGKLVRASLEENQDLYWALSGGGGGAYGIVWSITVKAHQDLPVTIASLNFTSDGISQDLYWQAIDAYQAITPNLTDAKLWAFTSYQTSAFSLYPVYGVNKTVTEVMATLRPLLNTLDSMGINYTTGADTFNTYLDAYNSGTIFKNLQVGNAIFDSRLLPRSIWDSSEKLASLQKIIRGLVNQNRIVADFTQSATLEVAGHPLNAVLPAWRNSLKYFTLGVPLTDGESLVQTTQQQNQVATNISPLKQLTPGSGAYLNEAALNDPDFKIDFYGPNYNKLLQIKDKWDPDQILYGSISVGGDRWHETDEGRLCRT